MSRGVKRVFLALGWPIAFVLLFWAYLTWPRPLDPDDLSEWILIKHYRGRLDDRAREFITNVYTYYRVSKGFLDPHDAQQNRIDVRELDGTAVSTFIWPWNEDYAAGWCEIRDINSDGRKEFILYEGPNSLRIVSFGEMGLEYRDQYEVGSVRSEIEAVDLDMDQTTEFIIEEWFPETRLALDWIPFPRIKHWDPQNGFTDVSKHFPDYYRTVVIPQFERRARNYPEKKALYLQALQQIRQEILGAKH